MTPELPGASLPETRDRPSERTVRKLRPTQAVRITLANGDVIFVHVPHGRSHASDVTISAQQSVEFQIKVVQFDNGKTTQ